VVFQDGMIVLQPTKEFCKLAWRSWIETDMQLNQLLLLEWKKSSNTLWGYTLPTTLWVCLTSYAKKNPPSNSINFSI
jgi:hypothetical protein